MEWVHWGYLIGCIILPIVLVNNITHKKWTVYIIVPFFNLSIIYAFDIAFVKVLFENSLFYMLIGLISVVFILQVIGYIVTYDGKDEL